MYGTEFLVYVFFARLLSMVVLVDVIGLDQGKFLACIYRYPFGTYLD